MVVTDIGAGHVLVANGGDTLADLAALHTRHVGQHALVAEVALGQVVGRQGGRVVGRQGDQVVEDACLAGGVTLEVARPLVGQLAKLSVVVACVHQVGTLVGGDVLAFGFPGVEHLLAEVQRPVERRRVVVDQLGAGHRLADAVDHAGDLADVGLFGLDPQKIGTVLQAGDAVQHHPVFAGARLELIEAGGETLDLDQLAVLLDHHVAVVDIGGRGNLFTVEEAVVLIAQVAWLVGDRDLLGQAGTQGVGTGHDHPIIHAQFKEGVTYGVDLGDEVLVGHGDLAVLVAALLLVGHLVLELDTAGTGLDHLLGQQVGGLGVAETGVDVGDDRHDVRFVVLDLVGQIVDLGAVTGFLGFFSGTEQVVELPGVGLAQEGVELLDQRCHAGLLVHGLVGQRTELAAQGGDHPAGQVEVAALGVAKVLLDGNQLLLTDEAVPAAQ